MIQGLFLLTCLIINVRYRSIINQNLFPILPTFFLSVQNEGAETGMFVEEKAGKLC